MHAGVGIVTSLTPHDGSLVARSPIVDVPYRTVFTYQVFPAVALGQASRGAVLHAAPALVDLVPVAELSVIILKQYDPEGVTGGLWTTTNIFDWALTSGVMYEALLAESVHSVGVFEIVWLAQLPQPAENVNE